MSENDFVLLKRWHDQRDAAAFNELITWHDFQFQRTSAGYVLYSTGVDMRDDGGVTNAWKTDGADMVIHR